MSLSGSSSSTWNEMVNASKNKKIKIQFPKFKKKCVTNWKLLIFHLNLLFKLKRKSRFAFCLQLWVFALGSRLHQPLPQTCWHEVIVTTNHPLEVKQPILDNIPRNTKMELEKYDPGPWKKNKKPIEIMCFIRFHEHVSFGEENCTKNSCIPASLPFLYLLSFSLVLRRFSGLSPNEIFPGWSTGPGKYLLGSIGVYQIHKSHCCSMGLVYLLTRKP